MKRSRKHHRRTLRRIPRKAKKGGFMKVPSADAFNKTTPVNSDNAWYKIA